MSNPEQPNNTSPGRQQTSDSTQTNPTPTPSASPRGGDTSATMRNLSQKGFQARRSARATCPFQPAKADDRRRWKVLLWGPTGTLKTRTALQFPRPAVIDLERGTECYRDEFEFSVLPPTTVDEITKAVRWLRDNDHEFRTLVIDPVTLFWTALQRKWSDVFLSRLRNRAGYKHEFYELGPREWATIKADFAEFVALLMQVDMNVVCVAHDKAQYSGSGEFMKQVGEQADTEKNMARLFDVIVRCERVEPVQDPTKPEQPVRFVGHAVKDRTNRLPSTFDLNYDVIADALGRDTLGRKHRVRRAPTEDMVERFGECVEYLELSDAVVRDRIMAFGAESFEDLELEQAEEILAKIEESVARRERLLAPREKSYEVIQKKGD